MDAMSKPVGYDREFVDQVPEDYFCKQCKHVAREPNLISCCGEVLCKSCVDLILQDKEPCPSCGDIQVGSQGLHKKYHHKILALVVYCAMKDRGCQWTGQLQHLDAHLHVTNGDCQYVDVDCPKQCDQKVQKHNVDTHLADHCPNRDYICQHCNFRDTFRVVSEHFEVCPYYPLTCSNRCGVSFERDDLEDHMRMCRLEEVQCVFSDAGCQAKFLRDDEDEHMKQNTQKHLALMAATTLRISQDFERKLQHQQQDSQHKQEVFDKKLQDKDKQIEQKLDKQSREFLTHVEKKDEQIKALQDLERKLQKQQQDFQHKQEVFEKKLQDKDKQIEQKLDKQSREFLTHVEKKDEQIKALQDLERKLQKQQQDFQHKQEVFEKKLQDKDKQIEQKLDKQSREFLTHVEKKDEQIKALQDLERKLQEQQQDFQHKQEVFEKKLQDKDEQIKAVQEQLQTTSQILQQQQDAVSQIHREVGIPPYDFTLVHHQQLKAGNGSCDSPPMYTHPNGYKFNLSIYPKGLFTSNNTCVSMNVFSLKSGHDAAVLPFPVQFTITLQLLNQYRDQDHYTSYIQCEIKKREDVGRWLYIGANSTFIPRTDLEWNADKQTQYLKDDCLRFRITEIVIR